MKKQVKQSGGNVGSGIKGGAMNRKGVRKSKRKLVRVPQQETNIKAIQITNFKKQIAVMNEGFKLHPDAMKGIPGTMSRPNYRVIGKRCEKHDFLMKKFAEMMQHEQIDFANFVGGKIPVVASDVRKLKAMRGKEVWEDFEG